MDVAAGHNHIAPYVRELVGAGIRTSLFVEANPIQLAVARAMGAHVVEIHCGSYCDAHAAGRFDERDRILKRIQDAAREAHRLGLEVHAGHGLSFDTVGPVAAIPEMAELNIGHFLVGEAIFGGLDSTIRRMRALMDQSRAAALGQNSA